ncbi:MAG: hypothetical protein IJK87_01015 [Prevotella sp.]|nr:hypothetical protein [Prevotella sp.]
MRTTSIEQLFSPSYTKPFNIETPSCRGKSAYLPANGICFIAGGNAVPPLQLGEWHSRLSNPCDKKGVGFEFHVASRMHFQFYLTGRTKWPLPRLP